MNDIIDIKKLPFKCRNKKGSIDIIKLCLALQIKVYQVDLEDENFNAKIVYSEENKSFEILVNINHPICRKRFSIAHEVSHYLLHKDILEERKELHRGSSYNDNDRNIEKEADQLAEELLIPEQILKEEFGFYLEKNHSISIEKVQEIAKYFKVSLIVANIRLKNLKYNVPYISHSYIA